MKNVRGIARALWLLFVLTLVGTTYVGLNPARGEPISIYDAVWAASFIGFPTAGAIVVSRLPKRPLGWLLLASPLMIMVGVFLGEVTRYFYDGALLLASWLLWVSSIAFGVGLAMLVTIPLFLPNGELPDPRWRSVGRVAWTYVVLMGIQAAFRPGSFQDGPRFIENPLGLEALRGVMDLLQGLLEPFTLVVIGAGVTSLIVRFRRSRGAERQQMKWLALGGATMLLTVAILVTTESLGVQVGGAAITLGFVVAFLCLPVSIAIAVMKTRLYEIDVVINRTLVYGALTAILALAYLGLVVLFQRLLGPITEESDLAVAGSTLAVAALFRPLRGWVQGFIDHRFYRRKYNAAETLREFSTRLRDQVDLDSLSSELVGVVGATMQPAHMSIWFRPTEAR
jgi:hypothetical protein